jgi:HD superfamily phosphodiesterase
MQQFKNLLSKAEEFVTDSFKEKGKGQFSYHNLEHTQNVVTHAFEIAAHYEISENDVTLLGIAAWFHDVGHLYHDMKGHEKRSVELMKEFMEKNNEPPLQIEEVENIIMATELTTEPKSLLQKIIKDADTYHFGTNEFKKTNKQVKEELKNRGLSEKVKDWESQTVEQLKEHKFYTNYCIETLEEGKAKNLKKALQKLNKKSIMPPTNNLILKDMWEDDKRKLPNPNSFITKGIQTSLRLTSENHLRLSDMADSKANILISVNAIIISVILSVLLRKIEAERHLAAPTFIFLGFSVITIIISIVATRPKVTQGHFSREDVLNKKTNLLFFGNFYRQTLEDYVWAMSNMLKDPDYLYGSMVEDIYFLGVVLGRKYKLLRLAYAIFMVGIIISVLAFSLAILFHEPDAQTVITTGGSPF